MTPSVTCPRCGMTSHHPADVREGYCGNCHDWTSDPAGVLREPEPDEIDRALDAARPTRWLTAADKQRAREVAESLLPLADWQREKLSLLLNPGRGGRP